MAWVRLDDQFPDHPKVAGLSNDALCLHITALCWTAKQQTDGHLPCVLLKRLAWRCHAPAMAVAELVAAGVWDDEGESGWRIHDYLDYNPSKAELDALAATRSAAGKAGASARWQDHSKTHGKPHSKSDGKMMPHTPSPSPIREMRDRPPASAPSSPQEPADSEFGTALSKLESLGMMTGSALLEFQALWPDLRNGRRAWIDDAVTVAQANGASSPVYAIRVLANSVRTGKRPGETPQPATKRPQGRNLDELLGITTNGK